MSELERIERRARRRVRWHVWRSRVPTWDELPRRARVALVLVAGALVWGALVALYVTEARLGLRVLGR